MKNIVRARQIRRRMLTRYITSQGNNNQCLQPTQATTFQIYFRDFVRILSPYQEYVSNDGILKSHISNCINRRDSARCYPIQIIQDSEILNLDQEENVQT
jgi:hypothetical protein